MFMWSSKAKLWLHRVGYLTTLIVALEAAAIGYYGYQDWRFRRDMAAATQDRTRTKTGPVKADGSDLVSESVLSLLSTLPSLASLPNDSLRFVSMPSFGPDWFAIALRRTADGATATLVIAHRDMGSADHIRAFEAPKQFAIAQQPLERMLIQFDQQVEGWNGDRSMWTDGTPIAFERKKDGQITSGQGNSPTHYAEVAAIIRDGLAPYSPDIARLGPDWVAKADTKTP